MSGWLPGVPVDPRDVVTLVALLERFEEGLRRRGDRLSPGLSALLVACTARAERDRARQGVTGRDNGGVRAVSVSASESSGGGGVLSLEEVAVVLLTSRRSVQRLVADGRLPSVKLPGVRGRCVLRRDLTEWLAARVAGGVVS